MVIIFSVLRYTNDERVAVLHEEGSRDYSLRLSHVQPEDSAIYECRVDTEPRQVAKVKLSIIGVCIYEYIVTPYLMTS